MNYEEKQADEEKQAVCAALNEWFQTDAGEEYLRKYSLPSESTGEDEQSLSE